MSAVPLFGERAASDCGINRPQINVSGSNCAGGVLPQYSRNERIRVSAGKVAGFFCVRRSIRVFNWVKRASADGVNQAANGLARL